MSSNFRNANNTTTLEATTVIADEFMNVPSYTTSQLPSASAQELGSLLYNKTLGQMVYVGLSGGSNFYYTIGTSQLPPTSYWTQGSTINDITNTNTAKVQIANGLQMTNLSSTGYIKNDIQGNFSTVSTIPNSDINYNVGISLTAYKNIEVYNGNIRCYGDGLSGGQIYSDYSCRGNWYVFVNDPITPNQFNNFWMSNNVEKPGKATLMSNINPIAINVDVNAPPANRYVDFCNMEINNITNAKANTAILTTCNTNNLNISNGSLIMTSTGAKMSVETATNELNIKNTGFYNNYADGDTTYTTPVTQISNQNSSNPTLATVFANNNTQRVSFGGFPSSNSQRYSFTGGNVEIFNNLSVSGSANVQDFGIQGSVLTNIVVPSNKNLRWNVAPANVTNQHDVINLDYLQTNYYDKTTSDGKYATSATLSNYVKNNVDGVLTGSLQITHAQTASLDVPNSDKATLYLQDANGSPNNGGVLGFGTPQGKFGSIKGNLTFGGENTTGNLTFCLNATAGSVNQTSVLLLDNNGDMDVQRGRLYVSIPDSVNGQNQPLIVGRCLSDYNKQIYMGYNNSTDIGYIQSIKQGDTGKPLVLNEAGGSVRINGGSGTEALNVNGNAFIGDNYRLYYGNTNVFQVKPAGFNYLDTNASQIRNFIDSNRYTVLQNNGGDTELYIHSPQANETRITMASPSGVKYFIRRVSDDFAIYDNKNSRNLLSYDPTPAITTWKSTLDLDGATFLYKKQGKNAGAVFKAQFNVDAIGAAITLDTAYEALNITSGTYSAVGHYKVICAISQTSGQYRSGFVSVSDSGLTVSCEYDTANNLYDILVRDTANVATDTTSFSFMAL